LSVVNPIRIAKLDPWARKKEDKDRIWSSRDAPVDRRAVRAGTLSRANRSLRTVDRSLR